jgi:hypothetical protein
MMKFPNKKQKTASCENYKFNILNEEQKIQILVIYAVKSDDDCWKNQRKSNSGAKARKTTH